jgi:hypothetical protein
MNDQERDPRLVAVIDQAFAYALATGLIERVGIDEKGRVVPPGHRLGAPVRAGLSRADLSIVVLPADLGSQATTGYPVSPDTPASACSRWGQT